MLCVCVCATCMVLRVFNVRCKLLCCACFVLCLWRACIHIPLCVAVPRMRIVWCVLLCCVCCVARGALTHLIVRSILFMLRLYVSYVVRVRCVVFSMWCVLALHSVCYNRCCLVARLMHAVLRVTRVVCVLCCV